MTLSNQQGQAPALKMEMCTTLDEWKVVRHCRQNYFFDKQPIDDPYTWTFGHGDHRHFVLYQGTEIAEALVDIGFNLLHANLILATCDVKNAASKRVLEKALPQIQ